MTQTLANQEQVLDCRPSSHYSAAQARSAMGHFLVGKFASLVLALATLIVLLRGLSIPEYGAYVGLLAARGILNMLSSVGLDGMSARFIPELRLKASEPALVRTMLGILTVWLGALACTVLALWLTTPALVSALQLSPWASAMPLFISLVVVGGISNFTSGMLSALLLQRASQMACFGSAIARFILVAIPTWRGHIDLSDALVAEFVGSTTALLLALIYLLRYFSKRAESVNGRQSLGKDLLRRMFRFAALNYSAQILRQTQGPHGLRIAVASVLGISASAQFGFVMSLADTVQRYLPAVLLGTVIHPVLISRYVASGEFGQVSRFASLLFKINLMIVVPALVLTIVQGSTLVHILGGEKYAEARWLLPAAFALLITFCHTVIVSLIANTVEKNALQLWGGLFAIAGLVFGIAMARPLGIFAIILGTWIGSVAYNFFAIRYLRNHGFPYQVDLVGAVRLAASAIIGVGIPGIAGQYVANLGLAISLIGGALLYLLLARLARPFDASDLAILRQVIPGRFHWALEMTLGQRSISKTARQ